MNNIRLLSAWTLILTVGLSVFPLVGQAADEPFTLKDEGGFEIPPVLKAKDLVPPELLKGKPFQVDKYVTTDGLQNTYTITSDFGPFVVHGNDMLRIRVREIYALADIAEMKKTKEFAEAAKKAAKSPFVGAGNLLLNPVDTVTGVPRGAWRYATRVGEMVRGRRGEMEESLAKELIGFGSTKRKLAFQLGVDVYSSNKVLQRELNSFSWAAYAGGMMVTAGTMAVGAASQIAQLAIRAPSTVDQLNKVLLDNSPEDLRRVNREKLTKMGVAKADTNTFVNHPWYSPHHKTLLVGALEGLEGAKNREKFIKLANLAESEEEAFFFQRVAQMMQGYHENVAPVTEVDVIYGLATCHTAKNDLAVPLVLDYGFWSERAAVLAEAIARIASEQKGVRQLEIWVSGRLSPKAIQELGDREWEVYEQSYDKLYAVPSQSS